MFIVADGHGYNGHGVSGMIRTILPDMILREMKNSIDALTQSASIMKRSFYKMNNEIHASNFDTLSSGSTLTVLLTSKNKLVCANVGDSRAFLFSVAVGREQEVGWKEVKMIELTVEHKP